MVNIETSYSKTYKQEALGRKKINLINWPKTRYEASIFFAESGKRVLDVGCGNGLVLYNLKDSFEELYGIELSEERAMTAQKTLEGLKAKVMIANIEQGLDYEDEYFDTIICSDVIEHLVDVFTGFKEITRVLKKGGKLIINTPNIAELRRRFVLLFGRFPATSATNEGFNLRSPDELFDGGHLHYFTYSMLEKLCQRESYSEVKKYGFGRLGKLHNFLPSLLSPSCQIVGIK